MRLSDFQRRRHLPDDAQKVPLRRTVGWALVALGIAVGVYLFFRHGDLLTPLLQQ